MNKIIVTVTNGGPITEYIWKIDNVLINNNTDTLLIPSDISQGTHIVIFKGKNYCGNYSDELIKEIYIGGTNMYTQDDQIIVDAAMVNMTIKLRRTSTVTLIVTDEKDIPVSNATCSIGQITGSTDTTGKTTLLSVPRSKDPQTVTTSISE